MTKKLNKGRRALPFAIRVFLIITVLLIVPIYCMFIYLNSSFTRYMDEEISSKVVQNIANSQEEISRKLENLINVSNMFASDPDYEKMMNSNLSHYEKSRYFDDFVNKLTSSNIFSLNELKITYFDDDKQIYSNWSVNYNDYDFLLEQDWVKQSGTARGYITWNMFDSSYIQEEKGKDIHYISLARPFFFSQAGEETRTGMLLISMNVEVLHNLLKKYTYSEHDSIFFCSNETMLEPSFPDIDGIADDAQKALARVQGSSGSFTTTLAQNKYMVSYYKLPKPWSYHDDDVQVVAMIDYQNVAEKTERFVMRMTAFFVIFTAFMLVVVWLIVRTIVKPIKDISEKVTRYQVGDILEYDYKRNDEIGQLYQSFEKMTENIEDLFYQLGDEYEVKEKYRFESMRAQLNPHFIFNTLNSIRWMAIIKKQDNIVESIDAMANVLQYSMGKGSDIVTLGQELESVNSYIYIQNMRYGEQYTVDINVPEALKACQTVKFSLQPIVENCIIHGFRGYSGKGVISITGRHEGDYLLLFVENNGNAISDEDIQKFEENKQVKKRDEKKVTGIGMLNVDQIIRITFGEGYGLNLKRRDGNTVVQYTLPYRVQEEEDE